jgi:hypothetical protein
VSFRAKLGICFRKKVRKKQIPRANTALGMTDCFIDCLAENGKLKTENCPFSIYVHLSQRREGRSAAASGGGVNCGVSVRSDGSGDGGLLEVKHLLEMDSIADIAVRQTAFMYNAPHARDDGTRAAG